MMKKLRLVCRSGMRSTSIMYWDCLTLSPVHQMPKNRRWKCSRSTCVGFATLASYRLFLL